MSAALPCDFVSGNHFDKYRSGNPVHRHLMEGFLRSATELVQRAAPASILEIGCGPGDLAARLLGDRGLGAPSGFRYLGTDISPEEVAAAQRRYPQLDFEVAPAEQLPLADGSFDLVIACEVLEHVDEPSRVLAELARVARRHVLVSVPWEPVWRMLNFARGKYLTRLGNTPGHVQHFSRRGISRLVSQSFEIVERRHPLPWTMLLAARPGGGKNRF